MRKSSQSYQPGTHKNDLITLKNLLLIETFQALKPLLKNIKMIWGLFEQAKDLMSDFDDRGDLRDKVKS